MADNRKLSALPVASTISGADRFYLVQGGLSKQVTGTTFITFAQGTMQTAHPNLTALSGLEGVAGRIPYFTGAGVLSTVSSTLFGRSLLNLADAAALKSSAGLANVDNTSDANKPLSSAQQAALDLKANLISPTFTTPNIGAASGTSLVASAKVESPFVRATGVPSAGLTGSGVELQFSSGQGDILAYNRTSFTYAPLVLNNALKIDSAGGVTLPASFKIVQGSNDRIVLEAAGASGRISLSKSGIGDDAGLTLSSAGVARWDLGEMGSSVGSTGQFYLSRRGAGVVFTVDDTRKVTFGAGIEVGSGIKFPAAETPSSDPNTLTDVRRSSWNADLYLGGTQTGMTYASRGGSYSKVGKNVAVTGFIDLSAKGSSTGQLSMNLPFPIAGNAYIGALIPVASGGIALAGPIIIAGNAGTTIVNFFMQTSTGITTMNNTHIANNFAVQYSFTYIAA